MGAADALAAIELFPDLIGTSLHHSLLTHFQTHAKDLSSYQSTQDGRWHNILTDPESVLETSSSAMILYRVQLPWFRLI